ncbi:MAG: hypothetical protein F6K50_28265 [Moorea sp. SIO3I7]|nr:MULTISPECIES: hypothetical protein [unclassified Moorena]NEN99236.1 hypothetical protein [Moorena sp. SIO3I7]NEO09247.1 hypothetical protein [Moorena sp. SIO3I8]NEO18367.1 hypothetical protein [Moorena sp. SIO4A5]NEP24792.1 hypothetical protein [Moorena sp. SIO3I6]NEQ60617.1 hypothetical protein [Moorena sp. SIO4A1]
MASNPMARFGICLMHCPPYRKFPHSRLSTPDSRFPTPYRPLAKSA